MAPVGSLAPLAPFLAGYLVFVGLVLGSFVNLAADRLPRGESIIRPRSHCRVCGRRLNVIDLLPVVGYLVRRGRCATCGASIGVAAPAVEATCGACVIVAIAWLGPWPGALAGLAAVAAFGASVVGLAVSRAAPDTRAQR